MNIKYTTATILASISLILHGCNSGSNSSQASEPASIANPTISDWSSWISSLTSSGYSITQGGVMQVSNNDCAQFISAFGTCFGNNAAAPYLIPQVPSDGTYMDSYSSSFNVVSLTGANSNINYRLSDNDALVVVVNLPPQAAYMGYQSYMFSRATSWYAANNITPQTTLSSDASRASIFGSLGNAINNTIVANQSGSSWSGTAVYITTSNQQLKDSLIASANQRNLNTNRMFYEQVPSNIITGTTQNADNFTTLIRYAVPENASAGSAWINASASNILVYRVSNTNIPVSRFGTYSYSTKQTTDESAYQNSLRELSLMLETWLKANGSPTATERNVTVSDAIINSVITGLVGNQCIATGKDCMGDSQDTDAYRSASQLGPLLNTPIIMSGVNHTLVNAATYVSLSVYDLNTTAGVASASQAADFSGGTLNGSAEAVLRALGIYNLASDTLKAQLPMLYTSFVARSCPAAIAGYCIPISTTQIPLNNYVAVTQRAYIKPGTTIGGNPNYMLSPKVIK
jgi:hypothetical protein